MTTRSQAKLSATTPRDIASPLARWTKTLIDPAADTCGIGTQSSIANYAPIISARPLDEAAVSDFLLHRQSVTRYVRDALQAAVDKQKENADTRGRNNMATFRKGDKVLLSTEGLRNSAVTNLSANKLAPRFIGSFNVLKSMGDANTLDILLTTTTPDVLRRAIEAIPSSYDSRGCSKVSQRRVGRPPLSTSSTRGRHFTGLSPRLWLPQQLALQQPHPLE